jgi:hypothetical protein
MSAERYICCDEERRTRLAVSGLALTGIDYIEVRAGATVNNPTFIDIYLVKDQPVADPALTKDNFRLSGGTRFPVPALFDLEPVSPPPIGKYVLKIAGGQPTDFSTYTLSVVSGAGGSGPPEFFDPRLATVEFSFKVECPSEFDCAESCDEEPDDYGADPDFDYTVRDYQGFRRLMLDRMAALVPGFREDDPVDYTTTLVEALAYRADQLSYRLDWVGTEAFLSTARSRTSLTRHARLVDYIPGEATSARVFVKIDPEGVADEITIPAATPLLVSRASTATVIAAPDYVRNLAESGPVFETVGTLKTWKWRTAIDFHTWSDDSCILPRGSCAATLVDRSGGVVGSGLAIGDFLLLSEVRSPATGEEADARPERRHVVRLTSIAAVEDKVSPPTAPDKLVLVEWAPEDALPFDLTIQSRVAGGLGNAPTQICAQAAGNLMLADHGISLPPLHLGLADTEIETLRPQLDPPKPIDGLGWEPALDRGGVARTRSFDLVDVDADLSAKALATVDPAKCLPAFTLLDDFGTWQARPDLLKSTRFSREFVIETAIDGRMVLRFGDGINGQLPASDMRISAQGRFGSGIEGNIGHGALAHVVLPNGVSARLKVSNPLPALGGRVPEAASQIRINAPIGFRRQERAVVAQDYADVALRHNGVANAVAVPMWTGAWQTMMLYIDRSDGLALDKPFERDLLRHMEHFRLIGFDIALRSARAVALDLEFLVCAAMSPQHCAQPCSRAAGTAAGSSIRTISRSDRRCTFRSSSLR